MVATRDVVELFDQVRSLVAAELGAAGRSLMVPTDEREARLWFPVKTPPKERALVRLRVRTTFESAGVRARLALGRAEEGRSGFRASLKQAERVKAGSSPCRRRPPACSSRLLSGGRANSVDGQRYGRAAALYI
jgi:GGDEF-like domain